MSSPKTSSSPELRRLVCELRASADQKRAAASRWFFKTGKGQYGEGDRFIGLTVPILRKIALRHGSLSLKDIERLLASPIHEYRLTAFEILVAKYEAGDDAQRAEIFAFYLRHTRSANNWDLVDASAPYIVGEHLKTRPRRILDRLAASENIWERRIAIVATLALIRRGDLNDTFRVAERLLSDEHDLIHKAVGWMLRETGKVSPNGLRKFLKQHYKRLPRTTLRYAIERFPLRERRRMLSGAF